MNAEKKPSLCAKEENTYESFKKFKDKRILEWIHVRHFRYKLTATFIKKSRNICSLKPTKKDDGYDVTQNILGLTHSSSIDVN
jgi:hypothetical protein